MAKVYSLISDFLANLSNDFTLLFPLSSPFFQFRELALRFCQHFFSVLKKAGVFNFSTIRESGKVLETHVNPYSFLSDCLRFHLRFTRKRNSPISRRLSS